MCRVGDTVEIRLHGLSVDIDRCIASIVVALNAFGLETTESCCGHGKHVGTIFLKDGRELEISQEEVT